MRHTICQLGHLTWERNTTVLALTLTLTQTFLPFTEPNFSSKTFNFDVVVYPYLFVFRSLFVCDKTWISMDLNKGKLIGVKLTVKANLKLNYERTNGLRE